MENKLSDEEKPKAKGPEPMPPTQEAEEQFSSEHQDAPKVDVLAPWGPAGPAPVGQWREDMLGPEFESQTIMLEPDTEGPNVATLVRLTSSLGSSVSRDGVKTHPKKSTRELLRNWLTSNAPRSKPKSPTFAILYLHGRNDYFFHRETAQKLSEMGGAFYALDLRKHGRSLRPGQTIGYTNDLAVYDREIGLAIDTINQELPDLPIVMLAHSTGGLIATLWAWRNAGRLAGLILNSAWLELQVYSNIRPAIHHFAARVGSIRPHAPVIGVSKTDSYFRSLAKGWADSDLQIPAYFAEFPDDPALVGWDVRPEWKWPYSYPAPAAWVAAVLRGHAAVEKDVHLDIPILAMASTKTGLDLDWGEGVFESDVVLDADSITARAADLSNSVTIARFPGKHDLLLSDPPVRQAIFSTIEKWLAFSDITKTC